MTGATGFLGNHVISYLLDNNYEVIASSLDSSKAAQMDWYSHVDYKQFDIGLVDNSINYVDFFGNPDLIIHLAWEGLPNYDSLHHFENVLPKHYLFLKNLVLNGLIDVTVTGTCFEYGFVEGELFESMVTNPSNAYGLAKDTLQKFLKLLQVHFGFRLKWLRLFYLYGKGQNPGAIIPQLEAAIERGDKVFNMSPGDQERDYLPVESVAADICRVALSQHGDGIYNCSSGSPVRLEKFIRDYLEKNRLHIELNLGYYQYSKFEPFKFWGNNYKIKQLLTNE